MMIRAYFDYLRDYTISAVGPVHTRLDWRAAVVCHYWMLSMRSSQLPVQLDISAAGKEVALTTGNLMTSPPNALPLRYNCNVLSDYSVREGSTTIPRTAGRYLPGDFRLPIFVNLVTSRPRTANKFPRLPDHTKNMNL